MRKKLYIVMIIICTMLFMTAYPKNGVQASDTNQKPVQNEQPAQNETEIDIQLIQQVVSNTAISTNDPWDSDEDWWNCRKVKSISLGFAVEGSGYGSFALGFGTVSYAEELHTYYFVWVEGARGWSLDQIPTDSCEVVETDAVEPYIISTPWGFTKNGQLPNSACITTYTLYVPVGTIYTEYNLLAPGQEKQEDLEE